MYCGKCGKEIPDGTKFCGNCGAEQSEGGKVQKPTTVSAPSSPNLKSALPANLSIGIIMIPILNLIALLLSLTKGYYVYKENFNMYKMWDALSELSAFGSKSDRELIQGFGTFITILVVVAVIFFILSAVAIISPKNSTGRKAMVLSAVSFCFIAAPQLLTLLIAKALISQLDSNSFGIASKLLGINGIAYISVLFAVICAVVFLIKAITTKSNKNTAVQQ